MPRLLWPQKLCLDMRGQSLPAFMRSATLSFFIAGPLVASEAKSYNLTTSRKLKIKSSEL